MFYQTAEEVLNALVQAYYTHRDLEAILDCVTDDVTWIGTEHNDSAKGKNNLRSLIEKDIAAFPSSLDIEINPLIVEPLGDSAALLTITGRQIAVSGVVEGFELRSTVYCQKSEQGWLIRSLHASVPNAEVARIALQHELNATLEKQAALLNSVPGGVAMYRLKKDGRLLTDYVSDGLAKICGYDDTQDILRVMAEDAFKLVLPEDYALIAQAGKATLETGAPINVNYRIYSKDGTPIRITLDAILMKNAELAQDDAAVIYAVQALVSQDVLRAKAEQDYYRMILGITKAAYFEIDEEMHLYMSDSFGKYKMSQYSASAILSCETMSCFCHPDDLSTMLDYLKKVIHDGSSESVVIRVAMTDGSYQWTELFAHIEMNSAHQITRTTGILRDVNIEWEKQKEALESALATAEKANQAKTDFLSRVSHDMRTPLNGILGLTTLLQESITDKRALHDLNELEMSGKYLLDLINDTLDMSRIESGKLELHPVVCDGRAVLNNTLGLAKTCIQGKNLKLNIRTENLPFTLLYVDVSRVEQIVMNVVGNAVKFTPEGGTIDITMTNVSIEHGIITDRLVIKDTGIGMSQEFLPHIFESFSQEDASRTSSSQGTGLGMAITKQLLLHMGGDITVTSEPQKGSCFTITFKFPIATDTQIDIWRKNNRAYTNSIEFTGKRVLLCEDHPLNATIATRLLQARGMEVVHAENGKMGVELFEQSSPGYFDAILMDIRMPVMDGIEAAKTIRACPRADAQTIPIIAMTANAFADDVASTRAAGMNAHLSKPIQTDLLFRTLSETLCVQPKARMPKILVVDDVEVNRAIVRNSLEQDYEILEAENGSQALDILRRIRGIDAVITDVQMPVMDGMTLIQQIRADHSFHHVVIIANTQFGDPEQEEALLNAGANDFVYKPTTPKIIEIRVRNALTRS